MIVDKIIHILRLFRKTEIAWSMWFLEICCLRKWNILEELFSQFINFHILSSWFKFDQLMINSFLETSFGKKWQDLFPMSMEELTFTCLSSGPSIRPGLMRLNFLCQYAMVPTSDSAVWRLRSASSPHTWGSAAHSSVSRTISQPTKI